MSGRSRWLTCGGFLVLVVLAYCWRLPRGADLGDESYYANFYVAWLRSPILETGDLSAHQPGQLLVYPFVRAYAAFVPDLTGLMLFLRCLYAAACIATCALILRALRNAVPVVAAVAVAATAIVFIPFSLPSPSYNTLGLLFSLGGAICWLRVFVGEREGPVGAFVWLGGLCFSLQTFVYPTLVVLPFGMWLGCWWFARRDPELARRFRRVLGVLLLGHLLVAATVVGVFGIERLRRILEFASAYGTSFGVGKKATLAIEQLRANRSFLPICAGGLLLTTLWSIAPRKNWVRLLHALGLCALLGYLAYDPKPTLVFRSHGIVLFLAVAGLPILRHLANRGASGRDRFLAVWYAMSIVGGLVTSWTSNNALFNFPVGAFGAIPAILLDWFSFEPGAVRTPRIPALSAVAVLLALGVGSVTYSYGEIPGSKLDARIHGGPFAGLKTTSERAKLFDSLRERLRDSGSSDETTTVLGTAPGVYLFTPMKVRTPLSWPISDGLLALTPILERHYADPANRPETIVWYAPPHGIHPIQQEMLAAEYVLQSRDDDLCIFRRRDVARPGEHPVLIQWGKGFWPEERDGAGFWRWALSEGRIDIQQYSGKPKACRIRAKFHSYHPESAGMTVTGPDFRRDFEIDASVRTLDLTLTLPPGNSTIRWNCNAVPYVHPSRTLVFAVRDYSVEFPDADGP